MNINIKLNKNFTTQFNKLCEKYGEEFAELQGLSDEKMSFTDFISSFIDSDNVANASIDSNSNISQKDIVTLLSEMSKPHRKLLAFNKIYYELNKKCGFKAANRMIEELWNYSLYLHDFDSSTFYPYCIKPEECCTYLLNGRTVYANFKQIYSMLTEPEQVDSSGIHYKIPKNLSVQDIKDGKLIWTKVRCISKKQTNEDMRYIKAQNGFDLITTENHRYILPNGEERKAKELTLEDNINTICQDNLTNSITEYNGLLLTKEMGWLIGMYLSEGYNQKGQLTICQFKEKNEVIYNKIISTLESLGIPYSVYEGKGVRLKNGDNNWERKILTIAQGKYAWEKCLCPDYIHFNFDFLSGVLGGIIDGDGTINQNKTVMIRMTSRTLINQIRNLGHHFGVYFSGNTPYLQKQTGKIQQRHIIYSASANMNQNKDWFFSFDSEKIKKDYTFFNYDKQNIINMVFEDGEVPLKNNEVITEADNIVFDLSTDSHHFLCNGVHIHNCFAYDIKDIVEKGLFFIEGYNALPPKHLDSFIQILMEAIAFLSRRQSGENTAPICMFSVYQQGHNSVANGES